MDANNRLQKKREKPSSKPGRRSRFDYAGGSEDDDYTQTLESTLVINRPGSNADGWQWAGEKTRRLNELTHPKGFDLPTALSPNLLYLKNGQLVLAVEITENLDMCFAGLRYSKFFTKEEVMNSGNDEAIRALSELPDARTLLIHFGRLKASSALGESTDAMKRLLTEMPSRCPDCDGHGPHLHPGERIETTTDDGEVVRGTVSHVPIFSDPNGDGVMMTVDYPAEHQGKNFWCLVSRITRWLDEEPGRAGSHECTTCESCGQSFNYASTPETKMGFAKCPHCERTIDQTGQVFEGEAGIGSIAFNALAARDRAGMDQNFGMVVLGAGGDLQEWVDGIAGVLKEEGIVEGDPIFSQAATITGNSKGDQGRKDLLLIFNPAAKVHTGKLAMWRLRFGDISWVDDYIQNYSSDFSENACNRLLNRPLLDSHPTTLAEKMVMILLQVPDDEDMQSDAVLKMLTGKTATMSPEEEAVRKAAAEAQGYGFLSKPQIQG